MKLRTAVLTSAFVMFATASQAADINSPFYLPSKGKMLSETSVEYTRLNQDTVYDNGNEMDGWYAKQTISYGVSDNMSVFAAIGNTFDNTVNGQNGVYNNSHNFDYTVGMKYNHNCDKVMTQFSLAYNTFQPRSFYNTNLDGGNSSTAWNKYVDFGAKVGYQMDNGYLPYLSLNANYGLNIVEASKLNPITSPDEEKFSYSTYAGVYKAYDKFSTDMGIRWDNVRDGYDNGHASRDDVYAQAAINYNISDDMSVGVYGDYLIGDSEMAEVDYLYTLGANLKVAF